MSDQIFFEVKLEFEKKNGDRVLTEGYILNNIFHGLNKLYGEAGAAAPIEIVELEVDKKGKFVKAVLSSPVHFGNQLRAGLTLQGSYQGEVCAYHVERSSLEPITITSGKKAAALRYY